MLLDERPSRILVSPAGGSVTPFTLTLEQLSSSVLGELARSAGPVSRAPILAYLDAGRTLHGSPYCTSLAQVRTSLGELVVTSRCSLCALTGNHGIGSLTLLLELLLTSPGDWEDVVARLALLDAAGRSTFLHPLLEETPRALLLELSSLLGLPPREEEGYFLSVVLARLTRAQEALLAHAHARGGSLVPGSQEVLASTRGVAPSGELALASSLWTVASRDAHSLLLMPELVAQRLELEQLAPPQLEPSTLSPEVLETMVTLLGDDSAMTLELALTTALALARST